MPAVAFLVIAVRTPRPPAVHDDRSLVLRWSKDSAPQTIAVIGNGLEAFLMSKEWSA